MSHASRILDSLEGQIMNRHSRRVQRKKTGQPNQLRLGCERLESRLAANDFFSLFCGSLVEADLLAPDQVGSAAEIALVSEEASLGEPSSTHFATIAGDTSGASIDITAVDRSAEADAGRPQVTADQQAPNHSDIQ